MAVQKKELQKDSGGVKIQGFAPTRIQAVTADAAWTPSTKDLAFCVPQDCTYKINDGSNSGTLTPNAIRVIVFGSTYTFDTSMNLEVM